MSATDARVLIIEDNDALRVMLFTILRHQPIGVDTASNADEALSKTETCDYSLILIDMDLPDGDSGRFLKQFRENRPQTTTFIVAVRDASKDVFIDPAQVSAIVSKPIEVDTIAEMVRECALVVPPPEDPLHCPPAESEIRTQADRGGSFLAN